MVSINKSNQNLSFYIYLSNGGSEIFPEGRMCRNAFVIFISEIMSAKRKSENKNAPPEIISLYLVCTYYELQDHNGRMDCKTVHSTFDTPPGVPCVSENLILFTVNLLSSYSKIDPSLKKLQKTVKIEKKNHHNFSLVFWTFWHPWHPRGRVNSWDIMVLWFVFDILMPQRHLVIFFVLLKLKPDITCIDLTCIKSDNITF